MFLGNLHEIGKEVKKICWDYIIFLGPTKGLILPKPTLLVSPFQYIGRSILSKTFVVAVQGGNLLVHRVKLFRA